MRLKIRYGQEFQIIDLNTEETKQLEISLSLEEDEGLSNEEREQRIQDTFNDELNKPEYNIWHRETRYIDPTPKCKRLDGRTGYIQADADDSAFDIMDYLLITSAIEMHDQSFEYDEICIWVCKVLAKKPEWAEAFIAVRLNDESIRNYAARVGESENNITQKLKRAVKKLKENYKYRQI